MISKKSAAFRPHCSPCANLSLFYNTITHFFGYGILQEDYMIQRKICFLLVCVLIITACGKQAEVVEVSHQADNMEILTIYSPAIEANKVGETPYQSVYVCLPPGYRVSQKDYPVVYYLHGFNVPGSAIRMFSSGVFDARDKAHKDFIFVAVSGYNTYHGSFYVNSANTGRWEDFIVKELVPLIDGRYRTLAKSSARGLAGHSMGGMGVLNIGLAHPDVFSCVYSLDPAVFNTELIKDAVADWQRLEGGIILSAYSAAYTGDGSYPHFDGSDADNRVIAQWQKGAGDWERKLRDYMTDDKRLTALALVSEGRTEFPWIKKGLGYLNGLMSSMGVKHQFETLDVSHVITPEISETSMMPFFFKNLAFE
jgi:pimeloyl-ACP methyl ester carboxylesterase